VDGAGREAMPVLIVLHSRILPVKATSFHRKDAKNAKENKKPEKKQPRVKGGERGSHTTVAGS
jgi:hypothetical protein